MKISNGDYILALSPDNKTYLLKVEPDKEFHTHKGILNLNDVLGKSYGERIVSSLDFSFVLLEPTMEDRMMKVRRLTQIIYPKDAALIILKAGIQPGMRVIECGIGSGALTILLSSAVSPNGRIYGYERRQDFIDNAIKNLDEAGCIDNTEIKLRNSKDGFDERDVDAVILDLPSPWDGIPAAAPAIKGGGRIVSLSPTVNQVEKTCECLENNGFVFLETFEVLVRNYLVRSGKTRPVDRMVSHTGYITVGRKSI